MSHYARLADTDGRRIGRLGLVFAMVAVFMVVEALAGWWTGSLALLSDAGHMATDTLGLGMSLAAMITAGRSRPNEQRTYGLYRTEILAALANAVLLFGVAGYVLLEAVRRLGDPPEILSTQMLVVAIVGLIVNLVSWRLLRGGAKESLNVEGAYLEVIADLIGSIGAILAAATIRLTGWTPADPILGAAIGLFILPRAWRLAGKALRILTETAPGDLDLESLEEALSRIPGVIDVHDLHAWSVTSGMDAATAHLMTTAAADPHPVLDRARSVMESRGIAHATLQVEPESHRDCCTVEW